MEYLRQLVGRLDQVRSLAMASALCRSCFLTLTVGASRRTYVGILWRACGRAAAPEAIDAATESYEPYQTHQCQLCESK